MRRAEDGQGRGASVNAGNSCCPLYRITSIPDVYCYVPQVCVVMCPRCEVCDCVLLRVASPVRDASAQAS